MAISFYQFYIDNIPLSEGQHISEDIAENRANFWAKAADLYKLHIEESIKRRAGFVRIGIGMLFAFGSCLSAWLVKVRRLKLVNELGITEDQFIPMKILWLAPQFGLLGIDQGLAEEGVYAFFLDRVSQSIKFFAFPLTQGVLGIGRFLSAISVLVTGDWIRDTIHNSHIDKYFRMLSISNIAVLVVYVFISCKFDWNITDPQAPNESDMPIEEGEARGGDCKSDWSITEVLIKSDMPMEEDDGGGGDCKCDWCCM
ncbi:hypothetical protein PTKIN_Ptkin03bG0088300 [Pterospermum kingtungense]